MISGSAPATACVPEDPAEDVAETGLRDVASNKTISVPGILYKTAVTFSDIMPRSIARWVSGSIPR